MRVPRTCPLCEATCGLLLDLDESGTITRVQGDPDDVFSRGFICPKGANLGALESDPDRLRQPLVRDDATGELVPATWDEAFARVAEGVKQVRAAGGPNAVAMYLGNPNAHNIGSILYGRALIKAVRTQNFFSASTVDQMPKHVSSGYLFGYGGHIPIPDLDRTQMLLMLGANPLVSGGSLCTAPDFPGRLKALKARGGRLVVVDPRRSATAKKADEHLAIVPGSDALWLMALVHVLFAERLATPHALAEGVDAVRALAEPFTPEAVAGPTGIDAEDTRRIARELAASPTAAVYGRIGTTTVPFGTLASWLVDVLNILTGNLDRPGGVLFPRPAHARHRPGKPPGGKGFRTGRWKSRVHGYPEVRGELPVSILADEILTPGEGRVRGLITIAGNPVLSTPNGDRLDMALAELDFMVSVDIYLNETTRHADVILPPAGLLYRPHYDLAFYELSVRNIARYDPPTLPLPEGALDDATIARRLTLAVSGQPQAPPEAVDALAIQALVNAEIRDPHSVIHGRDAREIIALIEPETGPERLLDFMFRVGPYGDAFGANPDGLTLARLAEHTHGLDLGPLEPRLEELLSTPSGRIELAAEPIARDVERLRAALEATRTSPERSLLLVGRRTLRSNNSWMHNLPKLVSGKPRCTLHVHPEDARRAGLSDGDNAVVSSRVGEVAVPVEITEEVREGVVCLPHGWGHGRVGTRLTVAAEHAGVSMNALTDPSVIDPLSGNGVLSAVPVSIRPL